MLPIEIFLNAFHTEVASATPRPFRRLKTSTAHTSYEWLAERVNELSPGTLLELGCGEGELLCLLEGHATCTGIDLVEAQLVRAHQRVPDSVTLLHGNARALPCEDNSFDVVVSHMSLMLMQPIAQVLQEVRRVLKPSGSMMCMVGEDNYGEGPGLIYLEHVLDVFKVNQVEACRYRDRELKAGWVQVLKNHHFEVVEDYCVEVSGLGSAAQLVEHFMLMYDVFRLPAMAQALLSARCQASFEELANAQGQIPFSFTMRFLRCE